MKIPNKFTLYRRERTAFDHLTLYVLLPSLKIKEDWDYDTPERGTTHFALELPTHIKWQSDKDHWSVSIRLFGFGGTLVRQMGY